MLGQGDMVGLALNLNPKPNPTPKPKPISLSLSLSPNLIPTPNPKVGALHLVNRFGVHEEDGEDEVERGDDEEAPDGVVLLQEDVPF
mmetsp:Transcript_42724/g.133902  ORF Transcript_42724/g.133902 Transcript_42724/m.133902 type:complete len:87 (-) Transcript_42724:61-321(-)